MPSVTITGRSGDTHVLLDPLGDHIVTRMLMDSAGYEREITVPPDAPAYDVAVRRAGRAIAFVENS